MVKKTSAWASWSSSSHDGLSDSALEDVQRGLEQRVRNQLPSNVEPGYEQQWQSRARSRRSIAEFESELASLHEVQLREFKQWVMCVHEEYKTNNMIPTTGAFPRSESSFSMSSQPEVASLQVISLLCYDWCRL